MSTVVKVLLGVVLGVIVLTGACVAIIGGAANEVSEDMEENQADAMDDVSISDCGQVDEFGLIEATGTINNDSAERSSYAITVEFLDEAGTRLGEANSFNNAIGANSQAQFRASGSLPADAQVADCAVADVTRLSAES